MARARSILLLLAVVLAGCGTSTDRDQARAAVERLYAAVDRDDGDAACRQLSTATALALAQQDGRPCGRAIAALDLQGGAITGVRVYVTNAKVDVSSGESAFLGHTPDGWKVTAVGCRKRGDVQSRPMDCEAES
jgi:uncharacterized protein YceK